MKSTLIELPPELQGLAEDTADYVEAGTVEELARKTQIDDQEVIRRLLLPGQAFGEYKILGYIASGGMGEIYAAERIMEDGRRLGPVALKIISPKYRDDWAIAARFKREAQISHAIRSPHVARVYEFGETDEGHAFMAMELMNGEELFDRLCIKRVFEDVEVVEIILQVLAGLRAVHDNGFIHRDLKPENIFFARNPGGGEAVKILDFGIAKRADEESDPYLSVVGKVYGTPEYIAPEQGLNPDVDHRADLYSVGVIMHELLSGSLPFTGETPYAIILQHQNDEPPALPSSVDPELAAIVSKALEKKADERFQSAREMADVLRSWIQREIDDGLGTDSRETANLQARRDRISTPHNPNQTPVGGVPRPDRPDTGERDRPTGLEEESVPPVQILSRPDRRSKERRLAESAPQEKPQFAGPDSSEEMEADLISRTSPGTEESSSVTAKFVTGLAVLLVVLAVAWTVYDMTSGDAEPSGEPTPAAEIPE